MLKPKLMFAPKLFGQQSGRNWNCHHGKHGRNSTFAVPGPAMLSSGFVELIVQSIGNIKPLFTRAHPPAPPGAPPAAPALRSQRRPLEAAAGPASWGWVTGSRHGWGYS